MNVEFEWTSALLNAYRLLIKPIQEKKSQIQIAHQIIANSKSDIDGNNEREEALSFLHSVLEGTDSDALEDRVKATIKNLNRKADEYAFPDKERYRELVATAEKLVKTDTNPGCPVPREIDLRSPEERFRQDRERVLRSYPPAQTPVFEPHLPYPWVKYPHRSSIVCAFAKEEDSSYFACSCSYIPLVNLKRLKELQYARISDQLPNGTLASDLWNYEVNETFWYDSETKELDLDEFTFIENICHQCVGVLPARDLPHEKSWAVYIRQEYRRFGMSVTGFLDHHLDDQLNETLNNLKQQRIKAEKEYWSFHAGETKFSRSQWEEWTQERKRLERQRPFNEGQVRRYFEGIVRKSFGLDDYGHGSEPELRMYLILKRIYEGRELQRNTRPPWLDGLELDVWIPELSIAFEYQGEQHFNAIDHWGGKEALTKTQERDKRKKKLCQDYGVKLICINYDDPLEEAFILNQIDSSD